MAVRKKSIYKGAYRLRSGLSALVAVVLAVLLFGIANYISYRHHFRLDASASGFYSLSGKTMAILEDISNRVDVVVYARPAKTGYHDIVNLLEEYSSVQPLINVARVDPDRDIARAEQVAKQYGIGNDTAVVFDMGGKNLVVGQQEIIGIGQAPDQIGKVVFKGEQAFTSALQSLLADRRPVVYFLQGHGEGDPREFDPKTGYSRCAAAIEGDNAEVKTATLGRVQKIPEDCDALVIAGPAKQFSAHELELIRGYMNANGRILLMLESMRSVGLKDFLRQWGVDVGKEIVIDTSRTLTGRELFLTEYKRHPITSGLEGSSSIFYLPCLVEPLRLSRAEADAADRPHVSLLAASSTNGWAETDWQHTPMKHNPDYERSGEIGVAVAVEKGLPDEPDVQIHPSRMVVFGDSDFVSNGGLAGANMDFFLGALNWLLERDELIGIAPKIHSTSRLVLTGPQIVWLGAVLVLGLPLAVALLGALVWLFRRH